MWRELSGEQRATEGNRWRACLKPEGAAVFRTTEWTLLWSLFTFYGRGVSWKIAPWALAASMVWYLNRSKTSCRAAVPQKWTGRKYLLDWRLPLICVFAALDPLCAYSLSLSFLLNAMMLNFTLRLMWRTKHFKMPRALALTLNNCFVSERKGEHLQSRL